MKLVSEELLQKHQVLPLFKRGNRLYVGIADPTQTRALDDIKFHTNLAVSYTHLDVYKRQAPTSRSHGSLRPWGAPAGVNLASDRAGVAHA